MTKRFQIHTIGYTCTKGPWCHILQHKIIGKAICDGIHKYEIADPEKRYTMTFETLRPELFIGKE